MGPALEILASAQSNVGKVRTVNEDAVAFSRPANRIEFFRRGALALVADGMGGAQGGSIASETAARVIPRSYMASNEKPSVALRKALEVASKEIYGRARRDEDLAGMGATCVALALSPPAAWAAWVGDSRLYLVRDGQLFQMTEDHSVVNEMVRRGLITAEEAFSHEHRNVVTRALGCHSKVEVAVWDQPFPVRLRDRLLLCSDGLHDVLTNAEILEIAGGGTVESSGARLIEEANERGGYDNISVVILDLVDPDSEARAAMRATREYEALSEVAP
jgi:serine/threonine protein phosphatase PrpC